jgi:hypothetical protein
MLKVKDIRKFRKFLVEYKKLPGRESDFIGYSFPPGSDGDDAKNRGFFNVYHQETNIDNKLSTVLDMAQDSQAIFEFVQNAVDCNSSAFHMYYKNGYLLAVNNGDSFKFKNVHSILGLAQSTKAINEENIGKFGVGFKLIHRLVGEGNGLEELTKDYCGPMLFSWHNKSQLEALLSFDGESLVFDDDDKCWLNEATPWFFKILLTCMPILPYPHDPLKDLSYLLKDNLFTTEEFHKFLEFVHEIWEEYKDDFLGEDLDQGSIFFLKLGKDKEEKLDEDFEYFQEGIQYALAFIEQMSTKRGLKRIYFNDEDPIEKDDVNLQIESVITIKAGTDEHENIKLKLRETEKRHDVQFIFAYQKFEDDNQKTYLNLKKSPNFYKYFPMGKEIWGLNFILHSNVFSIETSRRELVKDPLNVLLFQHFMEIFKQRLVDYIKNDFDKYCQIFLAIFTSDDPVDKKEGRWFSDCLFDPLTYFVCDNTPISGEKVEQMSKVVVKSTDLSIELEEYDIDKKWFYWGNKEKFKLILNKAKNWKIKEWSIIDIIKKVNKEYFPDIYNNFPTAEKKIFLDELDEHWEADIKTGDFWLKISWIEDIVGLVLSNETLAIKENYLNAFEKFKLNIDEINSEDDFIIKQLKIAESIIETEDVLSDFQNKIIIIDEDGEELALKDIKTNNVISFNIDDRNYDVKLSDVLPKEYGNSGLVEKIITRLEEIDIDASRLLGISSKEKKNIIFKQIKESNKNEELLPWQFVYVANYSLEKNNDYLKQLDIDVNMNELLDLYFYKKLPFPVNYSEYIAGFSCSTNVYPSKYAHEKEELDDEIIDWLEKDAGFYLESRLSFLEGYGLITPKNKKLKFRIALLEKDIQNLNFSLIKDVKDLSFHKHTVSLLKDTQFTFDHSVEGHIIEFFKHIFYHSKIVSNYMPYIEIVDVDDQENITYGVNGSRSEYNTLIEKKDIEGLDEKNVSLRDILNVVKESDHELIDISFWSDNMKLTGKRFELTNEVDENILKSASYRYDFPEWENRTNHSIRILKSQIPYCYKFKDEVVRNYHEGDFYYDNDNQIFYLRLLLDVKEEALYNAISHTLEENLERRQFNLLDQYKKLNPFKDSEGRRSRKNIIKDQLLNSTDELYDYEWFYNVFNWEYEAQNESIKGKKLKFSEIHLGDDKTLILSDYEYETIPDYVEFISDTIDIKLYGKNLSVEFSVQIKGFNEFELFLEYKEKDTPKLKNLDPFDDLKSVVILPNENLLFESLKRELFDSKILPEGVNLREYLPENYDFDYIEFVLGPPGTSKTTTLAIRSLITLADSIFNNKNCRLLILTPTNRAADVIIERMLELLNMSSDEISNYSVSINDEEKQLLSNLRDERSNFGNWAKRYGKTLSNKLYNNNLLTSHLDIHDNLRIISTTIHRLPYDPELQNWIRKTTNDSINEDETNLLRKLVLDEASMISLHHCIHSILKFGNEEKLTEFGLPSPITIAGDPFQLLPVGKTPSYIEEGVKGLKGWATENIYTLCGLNNFAMESTPYGGFRVKKLMTQYRSNPGIGKFFSAFKYGDKLNHYKDGKPIIQIGSHKCDINVLHYDVKSKDEHENPFQKIFVYGEYSIYSVFPTIISVYFAKMIANSFPEKSVSIICPYGTQTRLMREIVDKEPEFQNIDINVSTVHGYQGNEADIVIFLLIPPKMNPFSYSHFNNENLINVGISRAKEALIVLAPNPDNISNHYEFNRFLQSYEPNNEDTCISSNFEDNDQILERMVSINNFNDFNVINVENVMTEEVKYVFYCGNGRVNVLVNLPDINEIKEKIKNEYVSQTGHEQSKVNKNELEIGDPIKGEVIGVHKNQMTAFIKISSHVKCVVHRNNVSRKFVKEIGDILKIGQKVEGIIINIDPKCGIEITLTK